MYFCQVGAVGRANSTAVDCQIIAWIRPDQSCEGGARMRGGGPSGIRKEQPIGRRGRGGINGCWLREMCSLFAASYFSLGLDASLVLCLSAALFFLSALIFDLVVLAGSK